MSRNGTLPTLGARRHVELLILALVCLNASIYFGRQLWDAVQ